MRLRHKTIASQWRRADPCAAAGGRGSLASDRVYRGEASMRFSAAILGGAPVIFVLAMSVAQGCGSATQELAQGAAGASTSVSSNQGTAGSSGMMSPTAGGSGASATETTCTGENPDPTCFPLNADPNCNTTNSSTGATCGTDCRVPCGFDEMGLKVCTCTNGTYESCPCVRPDEYQGAPTAEFCTQGAGMTTDLMISSAAPSGTVYREMRRQGHRVVASARPVAKQARCSGSADRRTTGFRSWSESGDGICEGAAPDPTCFPVNPDPSCNSTNARSGSACSIDCRVACGFQKMGLKICTCEGGVYAQCPCPPPENYLGAPTAPPCQTSDGTTEELDDTPCSTEWEQCIGTDAVTGNTPRGCACLTNRLTGTLQWYMRIHQPLVRARMSGCSKGPPDHGAPSLRDRRRAGGYSANTAARAPGSRRITASSPPRSCPLIRARSVRPRCCRGSCNAGRRCRRRAVWAHRRCCSCPRRSRQVASLPLEVSYTTFFPRNSAVSP